MYVDVDLAPDSSGPRLMEPENLKAFRVLAHGTGDPVALDAALGALGTVDTDGAHAWVIISGLRALAGDLASSPEWSAGFHEMLKYAGSKGWLAAEGHAIRAHIERA